MKREQEMNNLISSEKQDVLFLVETDKTAINKGKDYIIKGYETIVPPKKDDNGKTRIIGLVEETKQDTVRVREDPMDSEFPSVLQY